MAVERKIVPGRGAKRFVAIFLGLTSVLIAVSFSMYHDQWELDRRTLRHREATGVALQHQLLDNDINTFVTDLKVLSAHYNLHRFLNGANAVDRRALAKEFLSFSYYKGLYDQVRFLDHRGMEIVRIDFNHGSPVIVPDERLQDKSRRYYVAKFADTVYVLHAFRKKTRKTRKQDINAAKQALKQLQNEV